MGRSSQSLTYSQQSLHCVYLQSPQMPLEYTTQHSAGGGAGGDGGENGRIYGKLCPLSMGSKINVGRSTERRYDRPPKLVAGGTKSVTRKVMSIAEPEASFTIRRATLPHFKCLRLPVCRWPTLCVKPPSSAQQQAVSTTARNSGKNEKKFF